MKKYNKRKNKASAVWQHHSAEAFCFVIFQDMLTALRIKYAA